MITFLFDRRSLALWTLALVAAAVLLFLGGLFVGVRLNLPQEAALDASGPTLEELTRGLSLPGKHASPGSSSSPKSQTPGTSSGASPGTSSESTDDMTPSAPGKVAGTTFEPEPSLDRPDAEEPAGAAPAPSAPRVAPPVEPAMPRAGVRTASYEVVRPEVEVAPEPAPEPAAEPASEPEQGFSIQLGAFHERDNALQLQAELDLEGIDNYLIMDRGTRGTPLYTVRSGRYPSRAEAVSAAADITSRSGRDTWVRVP